MAPLVPCAATATSFLYAEQNSVVCCCRKTLAFERLFGRHSDTVTLLVPNFTKELVVSCDSNEAIVWNPESGEEKNRFSFPERITAAAWMENGNVVLGSCLGKLVLFNPDTGSSDYKLTLDQEVTAIATAVVLGNWIFAVGYLNGSLLLYKVDDNIEVVYNMSHNPSPIVGLSWHASHPLLAMHDANGNLSTWKLEKNEQPTERRIVERRKEQSIHCWMGWSKGGRLLHYRDGQAYLWDVREPVPKRKPISVSDGVVGISIHGPGAKLFTMGDDRTVQLLDLANGCLLATRQHPQILPTARFLAIRDVPPAPRSPHRGSIASMTSDVPSRASTEITVMFSTSGESEWDSGSDDKGSSMTDLESAVPSPGYSDTWSPSPFCYDVDGGSAAEICGSADSKAAPFLGQGGLPGVGPRVGSTLGHNPGALEVTDLFPRTRSRMCRARFSRRAPSAGDPVSYETEILAIVFDWASTAEDLVKSEMSYTTPAEARHALLAGWLTGLDTSGGIAWDDVNAKQQLAYGRLKVGDIHAAVSLLLSGRLHRQAINMYEANGRYMEAMIASLLFLPSWDYQSGLLAKWARAEKEALPELSHRCLSLVDKLGTSTPLPQPNVGQAPYSRPQRDLTKISKLTLQTSFVSSSSIYSSYTAHSAYPGTHGADIRHVNLPLSSVPKTAIEGMETGGTPHERGQKLSRMVSRWKRKVSRDSGDGSDTPVPVTAYKDGNYMLENVI